MRPWDDKWKISGGALGGGQGQVFKVSRRGSGDVGALKVLHQNVGSEVPTERRRRMAREVAALKGLTLPGIPRVLDDNTTAVEDKTTPLYFVMEWIDGKTLDNFAFKKKSLENTIAISRQLVTLLEKCHESGIVHRDIKPNNLIIDPDKDMLWLVDFGNAHMNLEGAQSAVTISSQELGNRFLRLPELAPGQQQRDKRSDLTFAVGILFFLLTRHSPRLLIDAELRPPHVALGDKFPPQLVEDSRWPKVRSIFDVGFQPDIKQRWQSATELLEALAHAIEQPTVVDNEPHQLAAQEYRRITESAQARARHSMRESLRETSSAFEEEVRRLATDVELQTSHYAGGPKWDHDNRVHCCVILSRRNQDLPRAEIYHYLELVGEDRNRVRASYSLEYPRGREPEAYFEGPAADLAGTRNKVMNETKTIFAEALTQLTRKLEADVGGGVKT